MRRAALVASSVPPRSVLARGLAALVAVALAVAPAPLHAQSAADRESARRLMAEGRARRDAGDLARALEAFGAADALMEIPTTSLEAARAEVALGRLVEAQDRLIRALRRPELPDEPKPFAPARAQARALVDELRERIPQVRILIRGAAGRAVELRVDGERVPAEAAGTPRAVDPGRHAIVASIDGVPAARATIDVREREAKAIELDVPEPRGADPRNAGATTVPPASGRALVHGASEVAVARPLALRAAVIGGVVVAVAGVAVGAIAGGASFARTAAAKSRCVGVRCPPGAYSDLDAAGAFATTSDVAFAVAAGGAVALALGLLLPSPTGSEAPRVTVGPGGLRGAF